MPDDTNTNAVPRKPVPHRELDAFDRKILGALTRDARQSFTALGEQVGLSAPAIHERVKRMRASGVIKTTAALLEGEKIGKPFLAFVHVDAEGWGKGPLVEHLAQLPEVEEMHSVSGDHCLLLKIRTTGPQDLENLLETLYHSKGIRGTKSEIVLSTYIDRPVQAEATTDWPSA